MAAPQVKESPQPRLVPGEVEPNALGLPQDRCAEVVEALNHDLATMLVLFHQTTKHRWVAQGPEAPGVRELLADHAAALLADADALAERVAALGGVPVAGPAALEGHATVPPEPEGVSTLRLMLAHDLRMQEQTVRDLRRHVALAEEAGDYGTGHVLRAALARQEGLAHRLHRLLADESLVVGIARARFGLREVPQAPPPRDDGGAR